MMHLAETLAFVFKAEMKHLTVSSDMSEENLELRHI